VVKEVLVKEENGCGVVIKKGDVGAEKKRSVAFSARVLQERENKDPACGWLGSMRKWADNP